MATANYYIKRKIAEIVVPQVPSTTLTANYYSTKKIYLDGQTVNALEPAQYAALYTSRFYIYTNPF